MKKITVVKTIKSLDYVKILGIKIDSTPKMELLKLISEKLRNNSKFYVVTPNPEIVLQAQKNKALSDSLNSADFSIPDGFGLVLAAKFLRGTSIEVIKGRIFMLNIMEIANEFKLKVYLLGASKFSNGKAVSTLGRMFPNAKMRGESGFYLDNNANPEAEIDSLKQSEVVKEINSYKPDILFVAFGAPKQEIWIRNWLPKLDIGGAMAVGGSFDYLSGIAKLPPVWISSLHIEWFWRLIQEPKRVLRILNALILFPILVIRSKIQNGH